MNEQAIIVHITNWLKDYALNANVKGFIVGISGGVDSAFTAHLCAKTGLEVLLLNMPIRQKQTEFDRAEKQIEALKKEYCNVRNTIVDLTPAFESLEKTFESDVAAHLLSMANTRSRLRMLTLYAYGQSNQLLVAGTGNKIEDFGVGFFTKYGDGGVDISPIADLKKTEVFKLAKFVGVIDDILTAKPTDGLWDVERNDEDQMGATYPELEWAMDYQGTDEGLTTRQLEVIRIYRRLNKINQHKMNPIPVCIIPNQLR